MWLAAPMACTGDGLTTPDDTAASDYTASQAAQLTRIRPADDLQACAMADANQHAAILATCDGSAAQTWTFVQERLEVLGDQCLQADAAAVAVLADCSASDANQRWSRQAQSLVSQGTGLCLSGVESTLRLQACSVNARQQMWDANIVAVAGVANTASGATPTPAPGVSQSTGTNVGPTPGATVVPTSNPTPAPNAAMPYAGTVLRPTSGDAASLDATLSTYYQQWKAAYLTQGQCPSGQLYVNSSGNAGGSSSITVSEAHGYGMLALVLMSPFDTAAHGQFDQMVSFLLAHPSAAGSGLMAWNISAPCASASGAGSAADADLDIAYALLLADAAWGSAGAVNYVSQAKRIINAIMTTEVNQQGHFVTMWENINSSDSHYGGTRVSDLMLDHFRAFGQATGDARWSSVLESGYGMLTTLQNASTAKLLPDFATNVQNNAQPAGANFLEGAHDGEYFYNACRLPWRIAVDYMLHQDTRARDITAALVNGLRTRAQGNATAIVDGYDLQGNSFGSSNNMSFLAPLMVGAMVSGNQAWFDALWQAVSQRPIGSDQYYGNTIKLICMIVAAGHYRAP